MDHLRIPSSKQVRQQQKEEEEFLQSTLSFGRPRVLSDGALNKKSRNQASTLPIKGSSRLPHQFDFTGPTRKPEIESESMRRKQVTDVPGNEFIDSAQNTFSRGASKRSSTRSNPPERRGKNIFSYFLVSFYFVGKYDNIIML